MPGKNDAADSFMPQRPLARLMFEKTFAAGCDDNQKLISNPGGFIVNGVSFFGGAGENLNDLRKFTVGMSDPIEQMKFLLEARHWVPTAPFTVPCFPYQIEDNLTLKETPRVAFSGCQEKADIGAIGRGDANVLILSVPKFCESKCVMLLDLNEMKCYDAFFGQVN